MSATANDIARVRRMTNEPTTATYSDAAIAGMIELYPIPDERGVNPYYYDTSTDPPTQVAVVGWYPTYDLHHAAADMWEEKAGAEVNDIDYMVEGGVHRHSQRYDHCMQQARWHRSRASATATRLIASPSRNRRGDTYIGNLPEDNSDGY